jgi:hypothetical protein
LVSQAVIILWMAVEDESSWGLSSKAALLLSFVGIAHNLGSKAVHYCAELLSGGSRVNPHRDVIGDGLTNLLDEHKYEDPDKDIIPEHEGAYVADDLTPEHYVCPLSGLVSSPPSSS